MEEVFGSIFQANSWGGIQSVSGRGSDTDQTEFLVQSLPGFLKHLQVSTLLDVPCGDFHWMKDVAIPDISYVGADLLPQIIQRNNAEFASPRRRFIVADLTKDALPKCDLILCRDCLVHLSFEAVFRALENICRSEAEYLLTTTFLNRSTHQDILIGEWRPLNLQLPPFQLRPPISTLLENCTEGSGNYSDKALALWRIQDIAADLKVARSRLEI
ncbi:MAG: hypothetical protein C0483_17485 [Pirellula sp.]|nr:hypothetical protein [Pirellula sp.]